MRMNKPGISVVMATYNGGKYLKEQLESIFSQTLLPSEIIVCDDGSTDDTLRILKSCSNNDLLRYVANPQTLGVIENFKKAASLASEENFIAFADQDDVWMPHKLEELYKKMHNLNYMRSPALVYSDLKLVDRDLRTINNSFWNELKVSSKDHCLEGLFLRNIVTGCSMLINQKMKEIFLKMPSGIYMHDAWIAFAAYAFGEVGVVHDSLLCYRQHEHNITFSDSVKINERGSVAARVMKIISELLNGSALLVNELQLANDFYTCFNQCLAPEVAQKIKGFLSLQHKNVLQRKKFIKNIKKSISAKKG